MVVGNMREAVLWILLLEISAIFLSVWKRKSYAVWMKEMRSAEGRGQIWDRIYLKSNEYLQDLKKFAVERKKVILGIIILLTATYGYETFNFTLGGDEEREMVRGMGTSLDMSTFELSLARYGNWLFKQVFMLDGFFTPAYVMFLAVLFMGLCIFFWCFLLQRIYAEEKIPDFIFIVFAGIFMSVPQPSVGIMCYSIMNASSIFAMFLIVFSIFMLDEYFSEDKTVYIVIAVIAVQFATGTYEAHVDDYILASCICVFSCAIARKESVQKLAKRVGIHIYVLATAIMINKVVEYLVLEKSSYTDQFFMWGTKPWGEVLSELLAGIRDYFGSESVKGSEYIGAASLLFLAVLLIEIVQEKDFVLKVVYVLLGVGLFVCSFSVSIAVGGVTHAATHTALLLLCAFFWFFVLYRIFLRCGNGKKKLVKILVSVAGVIIMLRQIDYVNRIYFGGNLCAQLDQDLGYSLGTEIVRTVGEDAYKKPLVIVGKYRHDAPNVIECGMEGRSLFLRSNKYKIFFLNYLGFGFRQASDNEIEYAQSYADSMPYWPIDGCIEETNEVIVVHLGRL